MPDHWLESQLIAAEGSDSRCSVYGYDLITGTNFYDYDHITGTNFYDYDPITSPNFYDYETVVVIRGERIEAPLLSPSDSGWGGPNDSGWGVFLPPINPQPIDLMQHFEDFVMCMVTSASDPLRKSLPTNVLQTGANIFMEMMVNSRTGDIGMSQLAIP